jgi:hypothetical protein
MDDGIDLREVFFFSYCLSLLRGWMKCLHFWGGSMSKLRMKFFYAFVSIMFSICFHMFPIMFPKFSMFSILLIEEKVMSYVTVFEGHEHPLVSIK